MEIELPEPPQGASVDEIGHFRERVLVQASVNLVWNYLLIGKVLYELTASGWIEKCGETMGSFLASRQIPFGESTASKLMKVYARLILDCEFTFDQVAKIGDYEKAYIATNMIDCGLAADEALEKAQSLSRSDLTAVMREVKGKPEIDDALIDRIVSKVGQKFDSPQIQFLATILQRLEDDRDGTMEALLVGATCGRRTTNLELKKLTERVRALQYVKGTKIKLVGGPDEKAKED